MGAGIIASSLAAGSLKSQTISWCCLQVRHPDNSSPTNETLIASTFALPDFHKCNCEGGRRLHLYKASNFDSLRSYARKLTTVVLQALVAGRQPKTDVREFSTPPYNGDNQNSGSLNPTSNENDSYSIPQVKTTAFPTDTAVKAKASRDAYKRDHSGEKPPVRKRKFEVELPYDDCGDDLSAIYQAVSTNMFSDSEGDSDSSICLFAEKALHNWFNSELPFNNEYSPHGPHQEFCFVFSRPYDPSQHIDVIELLSLIHI